ncbi:proline dehydrogenase family protein [Haloarcula pellucida]|uniref:proline dehydrogenase n=1 Tax=Haloarcula pellucida TaxID=1427151 RepID=A0A830GL28_9EURY|nr:proline dehydrogenase family protein [Halomicroarcula pellucida]MBX0348897.1 proline dehydrogenase family protein [Halomicroarcula pellucida]GGN91332.1 proline dehydrogenase [Halomicroarcula pellucida]
MLPPVASRFVAGESAATVLEHARKMNESDIGVICNRLGEHYHERAPADADAAAYERLVADIGGSDLRACISVKPSQLGLFVGEDVFRENLARVVAAAADHSVFVWIDMEDHTTTDATLDAFEHHARERGGGVGVCLQANLRRTAEDLERLADCPGKVRLVKGAYDPPKDVAFREKSRVNEAYRTDVEFMFREFDDGIAIGSHDPAMLTLAADLHSKHGTPYEVQMLMGVREDAQRELAGACDVWQYAPYGEKWPAYFWRRVRERKENALFALRAIASG